MKMKILLLFVLIRAVFPANFEDNDDSVLIDWNQFDDSSSKEEIIWENINIYDVIIIGSGPAGCTAGLYLGRAGFKPLIFHGNFPGGQLMMTSDVENFPTFKGTGPKLVQSIQSQAREAGSEFVSDEIFSANLTSNPKQLIGSFGTGYRAKTVIIATGANAKFLGLPNEQKYLNKGVSACATCDGPLFKNQKVAVIGGGDTAITEALTLNKICSQTTLIQRSPNLTASLPMIKKLYQSNVTVLLNHEVVDVIGDDFVTGIQIINRKTNQIRAISVSAMFVAIGRIPATKVFAEEVGVDKWGYFLKTDPKTTKTRVEGVFVAGDCADYMYRQAITSAGTGCQAALDAEHYLQVTDHKRPKIN